MLLLFSSRSDFPLNHSRALFLHSMAAPPQPPPRDASHIPDLRTLIRPRGKSRPRGSGLRGRLRGPPPVPPPDDHDGPVPGAPPDDPAMTDEHVRRTDDDAAAMRLSAVQKGYLEDPFASAFARQPPEVRFPIMNRGDPNPTSNPPPSIPLQSNVR